jgi:dihydrodipicolinate synthase/N-acetylneuraminate lyase
MLEGALAAAVTPLRDGGETLDEDAVGPLVRFLADGGIDGALVLGTTGEGVMFSVDERRSVAERFLAARPEGFAVVVHCGAQTTRDTVALAAHAAEAGADAVAVIAPPYFPFDEEGLLGHFVAAAAACDPLPFYVYEFAGRSGYAVPVEVVREIRDRAGNLRGMKVSDTPFDAVRPYLGQGLDVFVGSEPLVLDGLANGAAGAVSGLATAFPEVVAALVHDRDPAAHEKVTALRAATAHLPFQSAMKTVLAERGVPVSPDVRAPLRPVNEAERRQALALLELI